jgi:hypothetical protein
MKINKLLYACLIVPAFLIGCGEGSFKEQEIKDLYNQYANLNPKVKSVSNIKCSQEGYVFPEEKNAQYLLVVMTLSQKVVRRLKKKRYLFRMRQIVCQFRPQHCLMVLIFSINSLIQFKSLRSRLCL